MTVLVCSACGSPSCVSLENVCPDALRADVSPCTCEWAYNAQGLPSGGSFPLEVDWRCEVHGDADAPDDAYYSVADAIADGVERGPVERVGYDQFRLTKAGLRYVETHLLPGDKAER